MKTTKITMLLLVVFAAIGTSFAQNSKSTMQLLMATEWEAQPGREDLRFFQKYSESKLYGDLFYEGKSNIQETDYYLSDEISENFEKEKVGKIKNGKYIIVKRKNDISVYEILKLTDKELIIKSLIKPGEIRLGGGQPTVYKPVVR